MRFEVDTTAYERVHGEAPGGFGRWWVRVRVHGRNGPMGLRSLPPCDFAEALEAGKEHARGMRGRAVGGGDVEDAATLIVLPASTPGQ